MSHRLGNSSSVPSTGLNTGPASMTTCYLPPQLSTVPKHYQSSGNDIVRSPSETLKGIHSSLNVDFPAFYVKLPCNNKKIMS